MINWEDILYWLKIRSHRVTIRDQEALGFLDDNPTRNGPVWLWLAQNAALRHRWLSSEMVEGKCHVTFELAREQHALLFKLTHGGD